MTATDIFERLILRWRSLVPTRLLDLLEQFLVSQRGSLILAIQEIMDQDDAANKSVRPVVAEPADRERSASSLFWRLQESARQFLVDNNVLLRRAAAFERYQKEEAEILDEAATLGLLAKVRDQIRRELEAHLGGVLRRAEDVRRGILAQAKEEEKAQAKEEEKRREATRLAALPDQPVPALPKKKLVIMVSVPPRGEPGLVVRQYDWLENTVFNNNYLPAVSNLTYDRVNRRQYGNPGEVARSVQALQAAGFEVRAESPEAAERLQEGARANRSLVEAADEHLERMVSELAARGLVPRPYQLMGIRWLRATKAGALLDEMGLGKTMQVLLSMGRRGLVLCPASVKGVWARECRLWRPDLRPTILAGLNTFRWPADGELLIVNYDILRVEKPALAEVDGTIRILGAEQTVQEAEAEAAKKKTRRTKIRLLPRASGQKTHYDYKVPASRIRVKNGQTVRAGDPLYDAHDDITPAGPPPADLCYAIDEGHVVKNETTLRARAAQLIGRLVAEVGGHRWLVTATPVCNRPLELKAVLEAIGAFGTAFTNKAAFARAFGNRINDAEAEPTEEASESLARVALRRTREDVGKQIPPLQFVEIPVALEGEALAAAEEIERILRPQVEAAEEAVVRRGGSAQEIAKAIERAMLAQQSIGAMSRARRTIAVAKLPTAVELLEPMVDAGQSVVVASAHREVCEGVAREDPDSWGVIIGGVGNNERTEIVEAFQAGKIRNLAMTIKTGGVGLTLTRSSLMIAVDLEWNPSLNEQCFARIDPVRGRPAGAAGGSSIVYLLRSNAWIETKLTELLVLKARMIAATVEPVSRLGGQLPEGPALGEIQIGAPGRGARAQYEIHDAPGLAPPPRPPPRGWVTDPTTLSRVRELAADEDAPSLAKWLLQRIQELEQQGREAAVPSMISGRDLSQVLDELAARIRQTKKDRRRYEDEARPARNTQEQFAADSLITLAGLDPDKAREINDQGFGGSTQDGHRLAGLIRSGVGLTDEDWQRAIVIARHHHRQVGKMPDLRESMRRRAA